MGMGLPEYIGDFAKHLLVAQAWINKGGPTTSTHIGPVSTISTTTGPMQPTKWAASEGELEVDTTEEELGGEGLPIVPKVGPGSHLACP